jgi:hypothetical protein
MTTTTATTTCNSRRRHRTAIRGLVLFAYLSATVVADPSKIPPPPPAMKQQHKAAQTYQETSSHRPPPPRPFTDSKSLPQHQEQHPLPPSQRVAEFEEKPPIPAAKLAPSPPKLETKLKEVKEPRQSISTTYSTVTPQVPKQEEDKHKEEANREKDERGKANKNKPPLLQVEAMRLQADEPSEHKEASSPASSLTIPTHKRDPLVSGSIGTGTGSFKNPNPNPSENAWKRRKEDSSQQLQQGSPLRNVESPPTPSAASWSTAQTAGRSSRIQPMQNPPGARMLPQQSRQGGPGSYNNNQRPPQGNQYGGPPPRQQQQGSQYRGGPQQQPQALPAQYSQPMPNQQRGPPRQYGMQRPAPQQRGSAPAITSTWKSLWGRVEKGLDQLANVEDVLTGRAQQLVSSVSSVAPRAQELVSSVAPSSLSLRPTTTKRATPVSATSTPTSAQLRPYGQKYQVAKEQNAQAKAAATGQLIRANGGASAPNGQRPHPPTMSSGSVVAASNSQPLPPHRPSTSTTSQQQGAQQHQSITPASQQYGRANPYLKANSMQTTTPPNQRTDPHGRSSRIPWDGAAGSSRQSAPVSKSSAPVPLPAYEIEDKSWRSRLLKLIPPVPRIPSPGRLLRFGKSSTSYHYASLDAWDDVDDDKSRRGGFFGLFRGKSKDESIASQTHRPSTHKGGDALAPPLTSIMARCNNGKTTSLLSTADEKQCRSMGRYQAGFDIVFVMFLLLGMQQIADLGTVALPTSLDDLASTTLPLVATMLRDALQTWAPFSLGYAYLARASKKALFGTRVDALASSVGTAVQDESQYAQLYLRLAAALPMDTKLPGKLYEAAASQVQTLVSSTQLNTFVALVLSSLVLMTVSLVRPIFVAIATGFTQLVLLKEWRSWPIAWNALGGAIKEVFQSLYLSSESLIARGLTSFLDNPMQFAVHLSIAGSLLVAALIPNLPSNWQSLEHPVPAG